MVNLHRRLRIALLAGTLRQGGAEKQLIYMVQGLRQVGVDVRVYKWTTGEFYDPTLESLGVQSHWVGRFSSPLIRLAVLTAALKKFRPHIIQSVHFFTNLYATVSARLYKAVAIGSIRGDVPDALDGDKIWGRWSLRMPPTLLVNSCAARRAAESLGVKPERIRVLPNVIDLPRFDAEASAVTLEEHGECEAVAIAVGSLVRVKRFDRFLAALALARRDVPNLKGILVGDGPEAVILQASSRDLGLSPDSVRFLGRRTDVPKLLKQAAMLVLCSDHEGFPNVLLEAMAARLPVITTPAGDAGEVVKDSITGYVVSFDDIEGMAQRMVRLAKSPSLCQRLGEAGRQRVEQYYDSKDLSGRLLTVYHHVAQQLGNQQVMNILSSMAPTT